MKPFFTLLLITIFFCSFKMGAQFSYKNYILKGKGFVRMHFMNSADTSSYMYLKEKYNILGVPHYTLIDRDGNIIANNVQSGSLESIIKSNL